jgi:predicted nucleic acid-binding protein
MSDRAFIDTNVFVYSFDPLRSPGKAEVATRLIEAAIDGDYGVISYQVIQEFVSVARRKFRWPPNLREFLAIVDGTFRPMRIVHSSLDLFQSALTLQERHRLSWYDSLIVAAAAEAGCNLLYTEDMQHGLRANGVTLTNPFL